MFCFIKESLAFISFVVLQNVTRLPHLLNRLGGFGHGATGAALPAASDAAGAVAELASKEAAARRYRASHFTYVGVLLQIGRFLRRDSNSSSSNGSSSSSSSSSSSNSTTTILEARATSFDGSSSTTRDSDRFTASSSGHKSKGRSHGSDLSCVPLPSHALCDPSHLACTAG